MLATAGLPLPSLSRGRFVYSSDSVNEDGAVWAYTDEALFQAYGIRIAFTERSSGVSQGAFASLDLGRDEPLATDARTNRSLLLDALGIPGEVDGWVCPEQVHESDIAELGSSEDYRQFLVSEHKAYDAVIATSPGIPVMLRYADCLPLILVAPSAAYAVVHCGWRGTVAHLAYHAACRLAEVAACSTNELNAYIGAYIHAECFEVGDDVIQQFEHHFGKACIMDTNHVNLGKAVCIDLASAGLVDNRIVDIDVCTVCNNDRFFSYRAQQGICGRHAACAYRFEQTPPRLDTIE